MKQSIPSLRSVMFQGQMYNVPEWAKYVAKDDNGDVYAYGTKPEYRSDRGDWYAPSCEHVGNINLLEIV